MTNETAPPSSDKPFGIAQIRAYVPIVLSMDKLNYDLWRELFETHCLSFGVSSHLDGTSSPSSDTDTKWKECDGLMKMWIYGTISESLLDSVLKKKCSARELWLTVEALFRDNKDGRALQLENDLRTLVIGDLSIHDFCQKLKSISDLLANIDYPVSDKALVMHMVNGLSEKFDNIVNVIIHKTPFPSFSEAHSMLLMEESRLQKQNRASSTSTPDVSSPNVLLTSASYSNPSSPSPHNHQQYHHNHSGRGRGGSGRGGHNNRGCGRGRHHSSWQHNYQPPSWFHPSMSYPSWTPPAWPPSPYSYGAPPSYGASQVHHQPHVASSSSNGVLGPYPSRPPSEAHVLQSSPHTQLTHAFSTMSLPDPSDSQWYMDTAATNHITAHPGSAHENQAPPLQ